MRYPRPPVPSQSPAFRLPDGTVLRTPRPVAPHVLTVGAWVEVDGRPRCVADLRMRVGGGRLVHLVGRPQRIVPLSARDTIGLYTATAPDASTSPHPRIPRAEGGT
jgi:hypothetical protein